MTNATRAVIIILILMTIPLFPFILHQQWLCFQQQLYFYSTDSLYRYSWPPQEGLEFRDVDLPYERTMAIRLGSKGNAYKHPADGCGTGTNTKLTKLIKQKACKDMFCTLFISITLVLKVYNHVCFGGVYKLPP